jgi:chromosome segregation ATPase
MSNQAPASTSLIYLYVGAEWSGPFQIEQIRFFRHHGQVESDTYAYDPEGQRHYTVGELLALSEVALGETRLEGTDNPLAAPDLDETSTPSTSRIFISAEESSDPTATLGTSLDALPDPLRTFLSTFRLLNEGRPQQRTQAQAHLREMASVIGIQLSAAVSDVATLRGLTEDILRLADYLANRMQDDALWEAIDALRGFKPETDAEAAIMAARMVISCLVEHVGRRHGGQNPPGLVPVVRTSEHLRDQTRDVKPSLSDTQELKALSDSWEQPHASTARNIMRDARKELKSTEADLDAIQRAYAELQATHARDLMEAREMLASLESARADEVANAAQAMAEVRSLAAEIHRLAEETLIGEDDLKGEIRQLTDELKGHDATAMAPLAEALLIRLVARLRNLAAEPGVAQTPGEVGMLREDLAKVRGELVGARAQILVLTDERDRLRRQLDEQRAAADRAIANSKEREQRLRSTVTALEVTKDLHQDVMRELDVQLTTAQKRVGEMEEELFSVRGELTHTRTHLADRTQELQAEMRRAVELQAMLEARRVELSGHLQDAEAQLMQAQVAQSTPGAEVDPELMEALAAKVNHLRTMFEATKRRLDEQQQVALALEEELTASRREASELRGRSDALTGELDDARVGLAAAKKRFEELNRAYARLESERESLQHELIQRKGTDVVHNGGERSSGSARLDTAQSGTARLNKAVEALEARLSETQHRLEQANAHLESERRRVQELTLSHSQFQVRVDDLTADRDHLRLELDKLHSEHFSEHSRHAASIAVATQSAIDSERRLKEAIARQVELEDQVDWLQRHQAAPDTALQQLSIDGEEHLSSQFVAPAQAQKLIHDLAEARAEVERLRAGQTSEANGQRHVLTDRLQQIESDLAQATAARDGTIASLQATIAERDRLGRELARLHGEHESAAVEHRVSLKAARDRLGESQARVQVLEKELEQIHAQPLPADPRIAERAAEHSAERISELVAERGRLSEQIRDLSSTIARGDIGDELPAVRRQLDQELERIKALTRGLAEAQSQSDQVRARVAELEGRATHSQHERDQLQIEVERLKGELLLAQAHAGLSRDSDHDRRTQVETKIHEVLADREQLLSELSRVNADLMQVRGRLVRAESESFAADRLPAEYARMRELELQVLQLRNEQQTTASELAQVRARLAQTTSERDQLHEEVARLRAQLAQVNAAGVGTQLVDELVGLRDKLTRAKFRIRNLRKERDELLARLGESVSSTKSTGSSSATGSSSVTGSSSATGFSSAQLAVSAPSVEAPGLTQKNLPLVAGTRFEYASGTRQALSDGPGNGSAPGRLARPVTSALVRRVADDGLRPAPSGFTSVIGRPRIASVRQEREVVPVQVPAGRGPWWWLAVGGTPLLMCGLVGGTVLLVAWSRPYSNQAVVDAEVRTMVAPIEGLLALHKREVGEHLVAGTDLAVVINDKLDRGGLERMQTQFHDLERTLAAIPEESVDPQVAVQANELRQQMVELQKSIDAERARLEQLASAPLQTAEDSQVWRVLAGNGTWLSEGQPVVSLIRSGTTVIRGLINRSAYERVAVGDRVFARLLSDGVIVTGRVTSISQAPNRPDQQRVADLQTTFDDAFLVEVAIDPGQVQPSIAGQGVRLLFTNPGDDLLSNTINSLAKFARF